MTDQTASVADYLAPLRFHRKTIAAVTVLTVVLGTLAAVMGPKTYTADTAVLIYPVSSSPTDALRATDRSGDMTTEVRIANSRAVAQRVVDGFAELGVGVTRPTVRSSLTASAGEDSRVLDIAYRSSDPAVSRLGAELAASAYLEYRSELNETSRDAARDSVSRAMSDLQDRLSDAEQRIDQSAAGSSAKSAAEVERDSIEAEMGAQQSALAGLSILTIDAATVIDEPQQPQSPDGLGPIPLVGGSAVGGIVLGIVVAWLLTALGIGAEAPAPVVSAPAKPRSPRRRQQKPESSKAGDGDPFDDTDNRDPLELIRSLDAMEHAEAALRQRDKAAQEAAAARAAAQASVEDDQPGLPSFSDMYPIEYLDGSLELDDSGEAPDEIDAPDPSRSMIESDEHEFAAVDGLPDEDLVPEPVDLDPTTTPELTDLADFADLGALSDNLGLADLGDSGETEDDRDAADVGTMVDPMPASSPLDLGDLVDHADAEADVEADDAYGMAVDEADDIDGMAVDEAHGVAPSWPTSTLDEIPRPDFDVDRPATVPPPAILEPERADVEARRASFNLDIPPAPDPDDSVDPSLDPFATGSATTEPTGSAPEPVSAPADEPVEGPNSWEDLVDDGPAVPAALAGRPTTPVTEYTGGLVATHNLDTLFELLSELGAAGPVIVLSLGDEDPTAGLTVGFELADELRALGARVLLIDGRIDQPSMSSLFEDGAPIGLAQVLTGDVVLDHAVQTLTGLAGLDLLPVGTTNPDTADQLCGGAFERLLAEARMDYHSVVIIGDTVPERPERPVTADASFDQDRTEALAAVVDGMIIGTTRPVDTLAPEWLNELVASLPAPVLQYISAATDSGADSPSGAEAVATPSQ